VIKNILITGCSSGIGYDSAHFLKKDYKVYATARNEKDVARLKSEGLNAFVLDVTKEQDITKIQKQIMNKKKLL
jgi:NADP-dependent 3-hydroxy acid dehydrogenase YdfG